MNQTLTEQTVKAHPQHFGLSEAQVALFTGEIIGAAQPASAFPTSDPALRAMQLGFQQLGDTLVKLVSALKAK